MTTTKLLSHNRIEKIGRKPVVVVPLEVWRKLEDRLEDVLAAESKSLRTKIARARREKQLYSPTRVRKLLGL